MSRINKPTSIPRKKRLDGRPPIAQIQQQVVPSGKVPRQLDAVPQTQDHRPRIRPGQTIPVRPYQTQRLPPDRLPSKLIKPLPPVGILIPQRPRSIITDLQSHLLQPRVIPLREILPERILQRPKRRPHRGNDPVVRPAVQPVRQNIVVRTGEIAQNIQTHLPQRRRHLHETWPHPRAPPRRRRRRAVNLERRPPMDERQAVERLLEYSIVAGEAEVPRRRWRRCRSKALWRRALNSRPLVRPGAAGGLRDGVDAGFLALPAPRARRLRVVTRNFARSARVAGLRTSV
ncbi:hypothetical protein ACJZ2D_015883 [Fusarium nematophilum]